MEIEVKGMTCGGCSRGVETAVRALEGVASCEVSLAEETARVVFDAATITPGRIVERIQQMGFEARQKG
ncbi:MAG: heavy metal-associated domain-containing protein [Myxococcota bacterium]|nr:heavy metal-associated domain-containing protein [Myxococcota bacterium]